jgi:uncharacterized membrane protein YfcA
MKTMLVTVILIGLGIGVLVGIVGTGGAFIIPALVYVFGMDQLKAQGTALLIAASPVWFFPFIPYWRASHYDLRTGLLLALGVAIGGYVGALWVQHLPQAYVRKSFALVLGGLAVKMFFEK